jgi:hypothetical protein
MAPLGPRPAGPGLRWWLLDPDDAVALAAVVELVSLLERRVPLPHPDPPSVNATGYRISVIPRLISSWGGNPSRKSQPVCRSSLWG